MQTKIICKVTEKGVQSFYVNVDGKEYFLFNQKYRSSVKKHFWKGLTINEINDYSNATSNAVRRTLDKLPLYLRYVEKEYGVKLLELINQKTNNAVILDVNVNRDRIKIYEQYIMGEKAKSLLALKPDLAKQWHPALNGELTQADVTVSARK